jgi:hypothetical protein
MGRLVTFPHWVVELRGDERGEQEPHCLVDPRGRRLVIREILRHRTIAPADPALPRRFETLVTAGRGLYLLRRREGQARWDVVPL